MKTTLQTVTPAQAAQWLAADINHHNRPLREHQVAYLAGEMTRGKWQTTHQGIAFAADGRLLDGQHRLAAIVKAKKDIQIQVTTGVDESAFSVLDSGMKRSTADRVHLVNDPQQNRLMVQGITCFLDKSTQALKQVAVSLIEDEFIKFSDHWIWAVGQLARVQPRLRRPAIIASLMVYHRVKPVMAQEFATGFVSGADLKSNSPILKLRSVALTGTGAEVSYWRCQAAMRMHMKGLPMEKLHVIAEDMLGNANVSRMVAARCESRRQASLKRWGTKAVPA